ncbi:hypothetical protein L2E82_14561 [Cichorium intybus]|uniref:Uncharacterized protein n=1 Tax=Cichorium intybus TaxID=13427 RepID=A0ACB9F0E9_CICIN|nr:hypothetical protein L2E82_14561 [Cichorium intybus]
MDLSTMPDNEDPKAAITETKSILPPISELKRWQWWGLVFLNIAFLLIGQGTALILIRFYYEHGGESKWTATLAQNAGFPILFIPFILFPKMKEPATRSPPIVVFSVYFVLGALVASDHLLFSVGLAYLPVTTYSLICATKLSFSVLFSYFINSQKFTILIINSVVALSLSACLVGVSNYAPDPPVVDRTQYILGFLATLSASALYALLLSATQLSFHKFIKKETFAVVLELQIYTSFVATCFSLVGLFASGEWRWLRDELGSFNEGSLSYAMTLVWTAVAWQICSVGVVGLIFIVSSLFSNVISTLSLAISPLVVAVVYDYTLNGPRVIAVLLGFWGFFTYIYQHCVDELGFSTKKKPQEKCPACSC